MKSSRNPAAVTMRTRDAKRYWAWLNREKVRESNKQYRASNREKCNRQARARMKRYRARIKATGGKK